MTPSMWKRVGWYYALACALTWAVTLPLILDYRDVTVVPDWLHYLSAAGPAVAAVVITAFFEGSSGVRDLLKRIMHWRFDWRWWLVVLSPILVFTLMASWNSGFAPLGHVDGIGTMPVAVAALLWIVTFGLGEEIGWRGFAQHHIQQEMRARHTVLIVGGMWIAWHLPFFFYQINYIQMGWAGALGWSISLMAGSVVLGWVYNGAGYSVLAVALWHGLFNLVTAAPASAALVAPVMSVMVIMSAVVLRNIERFQNNQREATGESYQHPCV